MHASSADTNRKLEKRLAAVNASIKRRSTSLATARQVAHYANRLTELERDGLEAERVNIGAEKIEFHPRAADDYLRKVRSLKAVLLDSEGRDQALQEIRQLVYKIVIYPREPQLPYDIEIRMACRSRRHPRTYLPHRRTVSGSPISDIPTPKRDDRTWRAIMLPPHDRRLGDAGSHAGRTAALTMAIPARPSPNWIHHSDCRLTGPSRRSQAPASQQCLDGELFP